VQEPVLRPSFVPAQRVAYVMRLPLSEDHEGRAGGRAAEKLASDSNRSKLLGLSIDGWYCIYIHE
jgi:hypothetical protein